jgi:hypothetical protein
MKPNLTTANFMLNRLKIINFLHKIKKKVETSLVQLCELTDLKKTKSYKIMWISQKRNDNYMA